MEMEIEMKRCNDYVFNTFYDSKLCIVHRQSERERQTGRQQKGRGSDQLFGVFFGAQTQFEISIFNMSTFSNVFFFFFSVRVKIACCGKESPKSKKFIDDYRLVATNSCHFISKPNL